MKHLLASTIIHFNSCDYSSPAYRYKKKKKRNTQSFTCYPQQFPVPRNAGNLVSQFIWQANFWLRRLIFERRKARALASRTIRRDRFDSARRVVGSGKGKHAHVCTHSIPTDLAPLPPLPPPPHPLSPCTFRPRLLCPLEFVRGTAL